MSVLHVVVGLGPVGRAVVDELVIRGLPVRGVARHGPSDLPAGVEVVEADNTDEADAIRAMAGAAVVYHAASAPYHRWPELLRRLMLGVSPRPARAQPRSTSARRHRIQAAHHGSGA